MFIKFFRRVGLETRNNKIHFGTDFWIWIHNHFSTFPTLAIFDIEQYYSEKRWPIFMEVLGEVGPGRKNNRLHFGTFLDFESRDRIIRYSLKYEMPESN